MLRLENGTSDRIFRMSEARIGTSAFTAEGWVGAFYPEGMKPADFLSFYATKFNTVEVDSTFYRTPALKVVEGWYSKTPKDFVFALKVPQVITHEKVLVYAEDDLRHFLQAADLLKEKLGPLLFQFGYFNKGAFKDQAAFLDRLTPFLKKLPKDYKFAIEIRNKYWIDQKYTDLLREHGVCMALIDQSLVLRPWEMKKLSLDNLITADFAYLRWLGDRKGIESLTKTWDKTIIDKEGDLTKWVEITRQLVKKNLNVYAYANNHYAGHGPNTVKLFWKLFES